MQAAMSLMRLRQAAEPNDADSNTSQPKVAAASPGNKTGATDESLDSVSVAELTTMEESVRLQYEKIVSEIRKRKNGEQAQSDASGSTSNTTKAPGAASKKTPRRSGRLTTSATGGGQQGTGVASQANPDMNDAEPRKTSPAHSRVEPAPTPADDSASTPLANQQTAAKDGDDDSVAQVVWGIVDATVASVAGKDATTSAADTTADMTADVEQKIDQQDPTAAAHAAIESALTPVSEEANKDGGNDDHQPPPAVTTIDEPAEPGVETPETEPNIADEAITSSSAADAMELA
jgi:hypothetical protein